MFMLLQMQRVICKPRPGKDSAASSTCSSCRSGGPENVSVEAYSASVPRKASHLAFQLPVFCKELHAASHNEFIASKEVVRERAGAVLHSPDSNIQNLRPYSPDLCPSENTTENSGIGLQHGHQSHISSASRSLQAAK